MLFHILRVGFQALFWFIAWSYPFPYLIFPTYVPMPSKLVSPSVSLEHAPKSIYSHVYSTSPLAFQKMPNEMYSKLDSFIWVLFPAFPISVGAPQNTPPLHRKTGKSSLLVFSPHSPIHFLKNSRALQSAWLSKFWIGHFCASPQPPCQSAH